MELQEGTDNKREECGAGKEIGMFEIADEKPAAHKHGGHGNANGWWVPEEFAQLIHEDPAEPDVHEYLDGQGVQIISDQPEQPGQRMPEGKSRIGIKRKTEIDVRIP